MPVHDRWTARIGAMLAALACSLVQGCATAPLASNGDRFSSLDGRRTAVFRDGRMQFDGRAPGPLFEGIYSRGVNFSRDGERAAYAGKRGSKWYLVADGSEYGPFDDMAREGPVFSPSGRHLTLSFIRGGKWYLWADGRESGPFDQIAHGDPFYSADESRMGYGTQDGKTWTVRVDGAAAVEGEALLVDGRGFTADNELYVGYRSAQGWQVRIGAATSETFAALNKPGVMLSPDRRSVAFIGRKDNQAQMCVNLVCGPLHRMVGARAVVETSMFPEGFWSKVMLGAVFNAAAAVAGAPNRVGVTSSGGSRQYTIVGSVVFSPDGRHHAYVASDDADVVMIGTTRAATLPAGALVEWMRFDDASQVLMLRVAGEPALRVLPLPGTSTWQEPGAAEGAATLTISAPHADALVLVDGRYAGMAPLSTRVAPGRHQVQVQSPFRRGSTIEVDAAEGSTRELQLAAPEDPVIAVVRAAVARLDDAKLAAAPKAQPGDIIRGRLQTAMPLSEEVLAAARYGASTDAFVLGESGLFVFNEYSTLTSVPSRYRIPYADFARSPRPESHPAFEVTLTHHAVVKVAGMSLGKDRFIQFLDDLRTALLGALPPAEGSAGKP